MCTPHINIKKHKPNLTGGQAALVLATQSFNVGRHKYLESTNEVKGGITIGVGSGSGHRQVPTTGASRHTTRSAPHRGSLWRAWCTDTRKKTKTAYACKRGVTRPRRGREHRKRYSCEHFSGHPAETRQVVSVNLGVRTV